MATEGNVQGNANFNVFGIDLSNLFGNDVPKSPVLKAAESQARRNLDLPKGLDRLRRNPAFAAERDRLLLGGAITPGAAFSPAPSVFPIGPTSRRPANLASQFVQGAPALGVPAVAGVVALGTVFTGLANLIGGLLFPSKVGRDEDIPTPVQERNTFPPGDDISRGPTRAGVQTDVPGSSQRTITKQEQEARGREIARARERDRLLQQNRDAMARNMGTGPQVGVAQPTDIPQAGSPDPRDATGKIAGKPWAKQTQRQALQKEILTKAVALTVPLAVTAIQARLNRVKAPRRAAAPLVIEDFPTAAIPDPVLQKPGLQQLGQTSIPSRLNFGPDIAMDLAPKVAPRASPKANKCQIVQRRRRRKGKCREGFFKESATGTKFTTWRVSDCATGKTIASTKGAKRAVRKILTNLGN